MSPKAYDFERSNISLKENKPDREKNSMVFDRLIRTVSFFFIVGKVLAQLPLDMLVKHTAYQSTDLLKTEDLILLDLMKTLK